MTCKTRPLVSWVLACALVGAGLLPTAEAQAAGTHHSSTKAKKKRTTPPKFDTGSGETRSERDQRLSRECRGRPNAGACEGYTR
jgi:hypothetical protein